MSVDQVSSRPSAPPPQPPPTQPKQAEPKNNAGAAAQAPQAAQTAELTRRRNTDSFEASSQGAQRAPGAQAARPAANANASTSAQTRAAPADRNTDSFQPAQAAQAAAQPAQSAQTAQAPSASGRGPAGESAAGPAPTTPQSARNARGPQDLRGARPPLANNPADPQVRARVEAEIARRLNGRQGNPRDIADRLSRALGNGDMRRGMEILERGLQNNRLNIGLAGINGAFGGPRTQREIDDLQRAMNNATGGTVDSVLDNSNGAGAASAGRPSPDQLRALTDIANLGAQFGIGVDVVSHSNGFNTLRTFLSENPNARLGNITLVNPNIPPNYQDTRRAFQDMVNQSDRVRLVTSMDDGAVPLSGANRNGHVWQQQINAAAAAGVQDITVLTGAGHSVESVGDHLNRGGDRLNLDFAHDPQQGRTVPRDPELWRRLGYSWTPENGLQQIPPRPAQRRRIAA